MRTHWSCLITEVSKLITHSWCCLDSNMGLYYTEDGSYRMVHLHYMPPNDKLNSRDLTTILFSVYVRWVQPLSATWFRLQGLSDECGSRPCFYARQLRTACVCQALCFLFSPVSARPSHGKCVVLTALTQWRRFTVAYLHLNEWSLVRSNTIRVSEVVVIVGPRMYFPTYLVSFIWIAVGSYITSLLSH